MKKIIAMCLLCLAVALPASAAELLVIAFNTNGETPAEDLWAYKIGHVVDIKPDGHPWSSMEGLPKFWRIRITGMSVEEAWDYLSYMLDMTDPEDPRPIGMRKWKVDTSKMTGAIRNTLNNTGVLTVTRAQALNYMALITR